MTALQLDERRKLIDELHRLLGLEPGSAPSSRPAADDLLDTQALRAH